MAVTGTITWKQFRDVFLKQYYSAKVRLQKLSEFENLLQTPDMSVGVYTSQSNALGTYASTIISDEVLKLYRFRESEKQNPVSLGCISAD